VSQDEEHYGMWILLYPSVAESSMHLVIAVHRFQPGSLGLVVFALTIISIAIMGNGVIG
jgi:hypothetical protein